MTHFMTMDAATSDRERARPLADGLLLGGGPAPGASAAPPASQMWLSSGSHEPGTGYACPMEYVSVLAGEPWSDSPACTHPILGMVTRRVADLLGDEDRQRMLPLAARLMYTAPTGTAQEQTVLSVRLDAWCARQVLPLADADRQDACELAIAAAEGWCDGTVTNLECTSCSCEVSRHSARVTVTYVTQCAERAAADVAWSAYAPRLIGYPALHALRATAAALADDSAAATALLQLLSGLIDEYDRITGR